MSVWRWFGGIAPSGRWCRCCGEQIDRNDLFGRSEGVCVPCRHEGDA